MDERRRSYARPWGMGLYMLNTNTTWMSAKFYGVFISWEPERAILVCCFMHDVFPSAQFSVSEEGYPDQPRYFSERAPLVCLCARCRSAGAEGLVCRPV